MSRIFAEHLQRRGEEAESEGVKILYKQLGEWYIAKGDWQKAIVYWIKGGDQELVLKRLSELEMSQLGALDMNQMIELYDGLSLESIKKYPVAYIYLTYFKMMREPLEKGRKLVEEVSLYMSQQEECEQLEGKLNLLKGILSFNQLGELFAYLDRIPESDIDRSSRNRLGELILMDNLGVSAIYHTKRGQYKEVVKQIAEKTELGLSYVTHAEYLMYQGKWKESEIMAMKAYFQAEISGCHKVMIIARYIQMRVYLVTGQKAKCQALLEESKMLKLKMKNNVLREMIDIQRSYLYYKLGEIHQVPLKFQKGEEVRTSQDVLGMATNNIIYVQALLERQEYVKVEIWSENILRHCKVYGNVVGLTCGTLFNAIAKSHIYGESEGKEKLLEAIEWGYQDGIIMPFVEQYKEIEACLRGIQVPAEQEAYFQKIKQHGMHFVEVSGKDEIVIRPSKESVFNDRETEILEYLRQGLTNQEIGNILHIAKVTVAKSITNIYRKMGVSNRIEAIQFLTE
ncbi:MAG: LuxR C-terminal-related transcriptional regulator [Niameybacter sp.]